jgi:hypothetical protein
MRKGMSKGDGLFKGAIYSRVVWRQRFAVDVFHSRIQGGSLPSCATTVRQPLTANQRLIVGPIANRGVRRLSATLAAIAVSTCAAAI